MVGGSLFIIYEADWARAGDGLKRLLLDEGNEDEEEGEDDEDEDEDDDDDDRPGPPFAVKIIDFAHTYAHVHWRQQKKG